MADDTPTVLNALVSNTEVLTTLNATLTSMQKDFAEARQTSRETTNTLIARVENLDRSLMELRLAMETAEKTRQEESLRVFTLLTEERDERRQLTEEAREDEKEARKHERESNKAGLAAKEKEAEWIKAIIREEMGDRRAQKQEHQALLVSAAKEIWRVGGQYIVAALAFGIIYLILHLTGANLLDIIGLARP